MKHQSKPLEMYVCPPFRISRASSNKTQSQQVSVTTNEHEISMDFLYSIIGNVAETTETDSSAESS